MGYEIVQNPELEIGDRSASSSTRLGSAVTVDVGRSTEIKGVLMRIPTSDYQEIVEELDEEAEKQENQMFAQTKKDVKTLYGGITKE
jgi:hypothetical protein